MHLYADIETLALLARILAGAMLFGVGVMLLTRRSNITATAKAAAIAEPVPCARPAGAQRPRLGTAEQYARLSAIVRSAGVQAETIADRQRVVARHLDSAEVGLARILAEIATVMPSAARPVQAFEARVSTAPTFARAA
jgi:hypothetical protein